jgi:HTH-type transcriptional regulator / antitoxin MqsA
MISQNGNMKKGAMAMQCPNCEAAELIRDTRDIPYTYKGESTIIPQVTGDFCQVCGEGVLEMGEGRRASDLMLEFNKQVNASIVDPGFITSVRKKLNLDQREAGEIFGCGVNAFSKYETGKVKPPVSLVQLFKVLERHPELLAEIRTV